MKKLKIFVFVIVLLVLLAGCNKSNEFPTDNNVEPNKDAQEIDNELNSSQSDYENIQESEEYDDTESQQLSHFTVKGENQRLVNYKMNHKYKAPWDMIDIYLNSYYYDPVTDKFYITIRLYNNDTELNGYSAEVSNSNNIRCHFITDENQIIIETLGIPSYLLAPKSSAIFTFGWEGITSLPTRVLLGDGDIEGRDAYKLSGDEQEIIFPTVVLPTEYFTNVDIKDAFVEAGIPDIEKAIVTSVGYDVSGHGRIFIDITTNKYVYLNQFKYASLILLTPNNESLELELISDISDDSREQLAPNTTLSMVYDYTLSQFYDENTYKTSKILIYRSDGKNSYLTESETFDMGGKYTGDFSNSNIDFSKYQSKQNDVLYVDVTSSSKLSEVVDGKTVVYSAINLLDGDKTSTWTEGVDGDGIGEWVEFKSKEDFELSKISLINGFTKTSDLYYKNNRIKELKIEFSNGESINAKLLDNIMDFQDINLEKAIITNSIKFIIVDVYKGSKWDDTCISEIEID